MRHCPREKQSIRVRIRFLPNGGVRFFRLSLSLSLEKSSVLSGFRDFRDRGSLDILLSNDAQIAIVRLPFSEKPERAVERFGNRVSSVRRETIGRQRVQRVVVTVVRTTCVPISVRAINHQNSGYRAVLREAFWAPQSFPKGSPSVSP